MTCRSDNTAPLSAELLDSGAAPRQFGRHFWMERLPHLGRGAEIRREESVIAKPTVRTFQPPSLLLAMLG